MSACRWWGSAGETADHRTSRPPYAQHNVREGLWAGASDRQGRAASATLGEEPPSDSQPARPPISPSAGLCLHVRGQGGQARLEVPGAALRSADGVRGRRQDLPTPKITTAPVHRRRSRPAVITVRSIGPARSVRAGSERADAPLMATLSPSGPAGHGRRRSQRRRTGGQIRSSMLSSIGPATMSTASSTRIRTIKTIMVSPPGSRTSIVPSRRWCGQSPMGRPHRSFVLVDAVRGL